MTVDVRQVSAGEHFGGNRKLESYSFRSRARLCSWKWCFPIGLFPSFFKERSTLSISPRNERSKLPGSQFSRNVETKWLSLGSPLPFLFISPLSYVPISQSGWHDGGDISSETRRYSCACTAKKNLPTGRSRNVGFVLMRSLWRTRKSKVDYDKVAPWPIAVATTLVFESRFEAARRN